MKNIIPALFFITILLPACSKKKLQEGTPYYIEVEQMDPAIEKCFKTRLFNQWASINELYPHPLTTTTNEPKKGIYIFRNYDDFDVDKDPAGTPKLMVRVYGDGDTTNTYFQVQGFRWQNEGIWQRFINLGNFRIPDRQNDKINPGKVDDDEICDHLVYVCVRAAFKGGIEN